MEMNAAAPITPHTRYASLNPAKLRIAPASIGAINLPIIVADEKKPIISPRLDRYMSAMKAIATGVKVAVAMP